MHKKHHVLCWPTDTLAEASTMSLHAIFSVCFLPNGCVSYHSQVSSCFDNRKNDFQCLIANKRVEIELIVREVCSNHLCLNPVRVLYTRSCFIIDSLKGNSSSKVPLIRLINHISC